MATIHEKYSVSADVVFSILILKTQQIVQIIAGLYVALSRVNILERKKDIFRLGGFYYNVGTWSPYKRSYRIFFFTMMTLISAIVAVKWDVCVQNFILQLIFMANLVYLFVEKPHYDTIDSL